MWCLSMQPAHTPEDNKQTCLPEDRTTGRHVYKYTDIGHYSTEYVLAVNTLKKYEIHVQVDTNGVHPGNSSGFGGKVKVSV
jgi:hypothetical protein